MSATLTQPTADTAATCAALQALQKARATTIRYRIRQENDRRAQVAMELGYHAGLEEKARKAFFTQADALITELVADPENTHSAGPLVRAVEIGIQALQDHQKSLEKRMLKLVKKLPVAAWCEAAEQRGFGLLSLGCVVGECGDLSLYANPAKVWRRLGLAPFTAEKKDGPVTQMGSTWKSKGGLSAEQWSEFGYCPRRRSVMYVISESLLKGNKSIYRARYDAAKVAAAASHPDWSPMRCHKHGMLLATKLLVKELWRAWNPTIDRGEWVAK